MIFKKLALTEKLTFISLFFLSVGLFTSVSVSAISHVFILIPGLKYSWHFYKLEHLKTLPKSIWCLVGLSFVMLCSVLFNLDIHVSPVSALLKVKYLLIGLIAIPAYLELFKRDEDNNLKLFFLKTFMIATSLASLSGIVALFSGFNPLKFKAACHPERACGLFGMYMTYAYGLSMAITPFVGMLFKKKHFIAKKWIFTFLAINLAGLYLSYTRGALVGLFVSVPMFFYFINQKKFKSALLISILGALLIVGFVPKVRDMFFNRQASNSERIAFFKAAFYAFKERPLFGYGHRNFEPHSIEIKKRYDLEAQHFQGHAHSNYFEQLASTGIVGLAFFLLWLFSWMKESLSGIQGWHYFSFPFLINFAVSGLFQYTFGDGENLFLIVGYFCLMKVFEISSKKNGLSMSRIS